MRESVGGFAWWWLVWGAMVVLAIAAMENDPDRKELQRQVERVEAVNDRLDQAIERGRRTAEMAERIVRERREE